MGLLLQHPAARATVIFLAALCIGSWGGTELAACLSWWCGEIVVFIMCLLASRTNERACDVLCCVYEL